MARVDAARLTAVISPLRRILLSVARNAEKLPEIPDAQIEILRVLFLQAPLSPGELSARLDLRRSTISNLLAVMESGELIERVAAGDDGRRVEVWPTAHAKDVFTRFDRTTTVLVDKALSQLDTHQHQALIDAIEPLEALHDALREIAGQRRSAANKRKP